MPDIASTTNAAPTGTVTFLFTDIEGSTRLLERLRGQYADLLSEHRLILRSAFAAHDGHEVDTQGDSFFVAFARASDALAAAVDAQRALAAHEWPDGVDLRVRMGIHTGEPLAAATGYVGIEVHRAARIAAAGHGGQILVSATSRDLIADELPAGVTLTDLGSHQLKDIRTETRLYQASGDGLRADFAPLVTTATDEPPPTPGEPPYRGLQAFEESDADLFFGREELVAELVAWVGRARFLALIGASGSGKSSLLRAGLIPAFRKQQSKTKVVLMTPTSHPLEELASRLLGDERAGRLRAFAEDLRTDPRSVVFELRRSTSSQASRDHQTLIAVDQLEELFTLCRDEDERRAFLEALAYASGIDEASAESPIESGRAVVVLTLRADFYASIAPYPMVRDAIAASQKYVGAMSSDELRRAIEEPARRGGWIFVPGLVDLLLRDVGSEPGALPLLSHALLETWQRRRGTTMTLRSYDESGGVTGAIARTADRVYETELTDRQRPIARDTFLRLTELGEGAQDTRRRVRLDELIPSDEARAAEVRTVLEKLAAARLVTVEEETVNVAHEALIREWPTLQEWLRSDRDSLRLHRRLTEAATEWQLSGRDESLLFRGGRLAQTRETTEYRVALNPLEREFLEASIDIEEREAADREASRQREVDAAQALAAAEARRAEEAARSARGLRRRAAMLAGALVIAGILAGVAFIASQQSAANAALADQRAAEARDNAALADQRAQEASESETQAEEQAKRALAQRLGADASQVLLTGGDPELASLLALNGLNVGYTPQADGALQRAGRRLSGKLFEHDDSVQSMVVTPDGLTMITQAGATVSIWDVQSGIITSSFPAPLGDYGYSYLELSTDGSILLAAAYVGPGALYRLSGRSPTTAELIQGDCPTLDARGIRTISGDGKVLATYLVGSAGAELQDVVAVTIPDCAPIGRVSDVIDLDDPALNGDGTRLAASIANSSIMAVWDLTSGQEIKRFGADVGQFGHSTFSADGSKLAVGSFDPTARVFDPLTGELLQTYRGHSDAVAEAVFSLDGTRLLTSSVDHTARIWDTETTTEIRRFVHADSVWQSWFSADGVNVFTASEDGTARLWAAGTSEEFSLLAGDAEVNGLAFSADGQRLASAAGNSTRIL